MEQEVALYGRSFIVIAYIIDAHGAEFPPKKPLEYLGSKSLPGIQLDERAFDVNQIKQRKQALASLQNLTLDPLNARPSHATRPLE